MVLISVPLKFEYDLLLKELKKLNAQIISENIGVVRSDLIQFSESEIRFRVMVGGHGKVQYAISNQYVLSRVRSIKSLVGIGTAGAISDLCQIGDVIFAKQIVEHDFKSEFVPNQIPKYSISELADLATNTESFKFLKFGSIACGDEDIVSVDRKKQIRQMTGADAVCWESSGGYRVAQFNQIPYYEFRLISDAASSSDIKNFKSNCQDNFYKLANALKDFLEIYN